MHRMKRNKTKKIMHVVAVIIAVIVFVMPVSAMVVDDYDTSWEIGRRLHSPVEERYSVDGDMLITVTTLDTDDGDICEGDIGGGNFWICPTVSYGLYELRDGRVRLTGCDIWDFFLFDGQHHIMDADMNITLYFQSGDIIGFNRVSYGDWDGYKIVPWGLGDRIEVIDPVAYPLDYIIIEGDKTVDGVTEHYYKVLNDEPFDS